MATTMLKGNLVNLGGREVNVGDDAPAVIVTNSDGLADKVVNFLKPLILSAITSMKSNAKEIAGMLLVSAIFGILYSFVPEESEGWNKGYANWGFSISALAIGFISFTLHQFKKESDKVKSDGIGLIIALVGIALSLGIGKVLNAPEAGALAGMVCSIIGCIWVITNDDWYDKYGTFPLNEIEEIIAGISVAIGISNFIDSLES